MLLACTTQPNISGANSRDGGCRFSIELLLEEVAVPRPSLSLGAHRSGLWLAWLRPQWDRSLCMLSVPSAEHHHGLNASVALHIAMASESPLGDLALGSFMTSTSMTEINFFLVLCKYLLQNASLREKAALWQPRCHCRSDIGESAFLAPCPQKSC